MAMFVTSLTYSVYPKLTNLTCLNYQPQPSALAQLGASSGSKILLFIAAARLVSLKVTKSPNIFVRPSNLNKCPKYFLTLAVDVQVVDFYCRLSLRHLSTLNHRLLSTSLLSSKCRCYTTFYRRRLSIQMLSRQVLLEFSATRFRNRMATLCQFQQNFTSSSFIL